MIQKTPAVALEEMRDNAFKQEEEAVQQFKQLTKDEQFELLFKAALRDAKLVEYIRKILVVG